MWLRGEFPRSFIARTEDDSRVWRRDFIEMFVERDVSRFDSEIAPNVLLRFLTMVAHYHGPCDRT